jgi:D-beta-D-heptose 7-phosphate kinase/D-beta-D-heptose 1-phosphate adenosyltransferase
MELFLKKSKVVICTGGFDPLHEGHIEYFKAARELGHFLVVGVNSDEWLCRKKGTNFQSLLTRMSIIKHLRMVTQVINFDDVDNTAKDAIIKVMSEWGLNFDYIFANGGDRTSDNIPEMDVGGVQFVFGVGGENKMNSSSHITERYLQWKKQKEHGAIT